LHREPRAVLGDFKYNGPEFGDKVQGRRIASRGGSLCVLYPVRGGGLWWLDFQGGLTLLTHDRYRQRSARAGETLTLPTGGRAPLMLAKPVSSLGASVR
jgi:hypothetical protein